MNACYSCEPTHNRDVRERGRCACECHRPRWPRTASFGPPGQRYIVEPTPAGGGWKVVLFTEREDGTRVYTTVWASRFRKDAEEHAALLNLNVLGITE